MVLEHYSKLDDCAVVACEVSIVLPSGFKRTLAVGVEGDREKARKRVYDLIRRRVEAEEERR